MEQNSGSTESVWLKSGEFPSSRELPSDLSSFDVCVVGAGIAGLSCAYHLVNEGLRVLVLDDGPIAGGETCRTTAHLSSVADDRFMEIERVHGLEGSRLAYQSNSAAIDRIEEIITAEAIDCDFKRLDGYLFHGEQLENYLPEEYEAAVRAGVEGVEYPVDCPVPGLSQSPCIRFPRQAQFNPIKYLSALAKKITEKGGHLVTGQFVTVVKESKNEVTVTLDGGRELKFPHCISATNSPIVSLTAQLRQTPYRTYAIAAEIRVDAVPPGLYWDTTDPYHYVRLMASDGIVEAGKDLLIIGGEDHRTGKDHSPAERFDSLYRWAKKRFPELGETRFQWSGQVMEPADGVAFIGRAPGLSRVYIVTGDSGMGMTHGTLSGMLITDLIQGRENRFAKLYEPKRTSLRSLKEMAREHLPDAAQLGAHLTPGEVRSRDDIPPGHGALVRHGLKKIATYRDENGNFHERSARCTHLGCVVEWNDLEKSWDCPCHGSRFTVKGEVLNGPATQPLTEYK